MNRQLLAGRPGNPSLNISTFPTDADGTLMLQNIIGPAQDIIVENYNKVSQTVINYDKL